MSEHGFTPSETGGAFMLSDKYIRVLAGPIGGGKSVTCAHELLHWATRQQPNRDGVRRTRFGVIRNTLDQLKTTTMKTVFEWFPPGVYGTHKVVDKTFTLHLPLQDGTWIESEWLFLPLDNPADIRKALSLEFTGVWLNECREIHPDVADVIPTRTGRFPSKRDGGCTRSGVICDTNMPEADSWWGRKMQEPPDNWAVFLQPPAVLPWDDYLIETGEEPPEDQVVVDSDGTRYGINPKADNIGNLPRDYYVNATNGKTADFINVYARSRYGRTLSGMPVYDKTFKENFHVVAPNDPLRPIVSESHPIVVGLDFGRTPAAVFGQMDPRGRINILDEVAGENMGIEVFIRTLLRPKINERFFRNTLLVACDPAGWEKSQVNEDSPADVLKREGFKLVRPSTNKPELRIQAVERLLGHQVDGKARLRIDPRCKQLIKGFLGGYRFKTRRNGESELQPDKNRYSHLADAMQYLALVIDNGHTGAYANARRAREIIIADAGGWT